MDDWLSNFKSWNSVSLDHFKVSRLLSLLGVGVCVVSFGVLHTSPGRRVVCGCHESYRVARVAALAEGG